jgi:hypothetical protein
MKPIYYLLLGLTFGLLSCNSGPTEAPKSKEAGKPKKPNKIIAWRDLSHINQTIKVGESHTWNYVFYNTGIEPVRIKQALSSNPDCSCTIPPGEVEVGGQDTVKLTCTFTRPGRESANITVEHDTEQGFPILILLAEVVE